MVPLENLVLVAQLVKSMRCTGVSLLLLTANFHPPTTILLASFSSSPQKYLNTHTLYCDLPTQAAPLWTWLLSKDTSECFCVWLCMGICHFGHEACHPLVRWTCLITQRSMYPQLDATILTCKIRSCCTCTPPSKVKSCSNNGTQFQEKAFIFDDS